MDTISKLYQRAYIIVGILAVMAFVIMFGLGYLTAKHRYNQPIETKIERDTIVQYDTVPHYYPKPVDVTKTKTEYRWLPTAYHFRDLTEMMDSAKIPRDSVLVEVPITSKHYSSSEYDAWVSGYEPSLDSIKVYQRTQLITEIRTISKPPNRWELDLVGGIDYNVNGKKYTPHVGGELMYKPNRFQVGVQGGIQYDDKVEPYVGGVVKFRLF